MPASLAACMHSMYARWGVLHGSCEKAAVTRVSRTLLPDAVLAGALLVFQRLGQSEAGPSPAAAISMLHQVPEPMLSADTASMLFPPCQNPLVHQEHPARSASPMQCRSRVSIAHLHPSHLVLTSLPWCRALRQSGIL